MYKSSADARARGDPTTPRVVTRDLPDTAPQTHWIKPAKEPCHRTRRPTKSSLKQPKEPEVDSGYGSSNEPPAGYWSSTERSIPVSRPFHCYRDRLKSPGPSTPPPGPARPLAQQDVNKPVIPPPPRQSRQRLSSEPPRPTQMAAPAATIPTGPYRHAADMHPTVPAPTRAPLQIPVPVPAPVPAPAPAPVVPVPTRPRRDSFRASEKQPVQENTSKNAERGNYEPIPSHAPPAASERRPSNYPAHRDYGATQTHSSRYVPPPQSSSVRPPGSYIYGPPQPRPQVPPSHPQAPPYPYQAPAYHGYHSSAENRGGHSIRPSHGGGGGYPDTEAMTRQYSAPQPTHVDLRVLNGRLEAVQQERQRVEQRQQHQIYQQQLYDQQHYHGQQQQPQQPSHPQSSQVYGTSAQAVPSRWGRTVREMYLAQGLDEHGNPPGGGPRPGPLPAVIVPPAPAPAPTPAQAPVSARPSGSMQHPTKSVPHYLSAPAFLRPLPQQDGELFPTPWTVPRPGVRGFPLAWPLGRFSLRKKLPEPMVFFDISQDPNDTRPGRGVRILYPGRNGQSENLPYEAKQLEVLKDRCRLHFVDMACCSEELEDWSVIIENKERGIRVVDVMTAIYETYRQPLTSSELRRHHTRVNTEACRKAFERRCARSADPQGTRARGLARVDLMGEKTLYYQMHFNDITLRYELYLRNQDQDDICESKEVRLLR